MHITAHFCNESQCGTFRRGVCSRLPVLNVTFRCLSMFQWLEEKAKEMQEFITYSCDTDNFIFPPSFLDFSPLLAPRCSSHYPISVCVSFFFFPLMGKNVFAGGGVALWRGRYSVSHDFYSAVCFLDCALFCIRAIQGSLGEIPFDAEHNGV